MEKSADQQHAKLNILSRMTFLRLLTGSLGLPIGNDSAWTPLQHNL